MSDSNVVRVGVGLLVVHGNQILLGERLNAHGSNQYAGPGGQLEYGETAKEALMREVAEECGAGFKVRDLRFLCCSDLLTYMPRHYIDLGFAAAWESGKPEVTEPDKLVSWDWYDLDALPTRLFGCVPEYVQSLKTGQNHFTVRN